MKTNSIVGGLAARRQLRLLERFCWGAGVAILAACLFIRADGAVGQEAALARFDAARAARTTENIPPPQVVPLGFETFDFSLWSPKRIAAFLESLTHDVETPLATLEIPKLGLRVPVLDGTDELRLNRGVGRVPGTARPGEAGNLVIAGHRDGFFRGLKDIGPGDELLLTTLASAERYVVEDIRIVTPKDVDVLDDSATPAVTLVTCYPFYFVGSAPQRYIVRALRSGSAAVHAAGATVAPAEDPS